jgi:hypothetical protein
MRKYLCILFSFLFLVAGSASAGTCEQDCSSANSCARVCASAETCGQDCGSTEICDRYEGEQYVGRYGVSVTGKRYRKNLRYLMLRDFLKGDKKKIFDEYGYTPHRLWYSMAGVRTERWKYLKEGLEFVFDSNDNLISEREIPKEDRRAGIYH